MKNILTVLLCVLMLLPASAVRTEEAPLPVFTFLWDETETPITLSTLPGEAAALLGKETQTSEAFWPIGTMTALANDSGLHFAGIECMRIALSYRDDELLTISCYITSDALPDVQPLIDALNLRYGEGSENTLPADPFAFLSPPADWTWTYGEDVLIEYRHLPESEEFSHMLAIQNLPAGQRLDEALNKLFAPSQSGTTPLS